MSASASTYTVQPGDTPMLITSKFMGNPTRMNELVRSNAHKATVAIGRTVTFRDLTVGEKLTVPPRWVAASALGTLGKSRGGRAGAATAGFRPPSGKAGSHKKHPGVSGHAYPQRGPHYAVAPRAGADGGGDDSGHGVEPILTIAGRPGQYHGIPSEGLETTGLGKSCCGSCAQGGSCESSCQGNACAVQMPPCSAPQAPPSIPGSTSFPVGFGQTDTSSASSSLSTAGAALSGWGVPLAVGAISIAAGFGLAYVIAHK